MGAHNYYCKHRFLKVFMITGFLFGGLFSLYAQDSTNTGYSMGSMDLPEPQSIQDAYQYDPISDRYIYTKTLGDFNITYPIILTPEEYQDLILKEQMKEYFKDKIDAVDGRKEGSEELQKNLLPTFYVNSSFFESIFGGNSIEVIPQGSVEMDLGVLFTKQDNPAFSPRNRKSLSFDFDQRISLSLLGKVGERLQVTANYDTQSTFDFQNQIKLEYTPTEDDIIQKIEVGNVSMPLNSTLIQGAQSLFGVKTELQFGKTTITGVFSEQKSETRSVVAEGGATINDFELFISEYDQDRHFFLAHYFRDNYDRSLQQYPFINSNIQITRSEVWITNRTARTENVRNIVALQDIGESDRTNIGLNPIPGGFINQSRNAFPDNKNNDFNPLGIDDPSIQSILTPAIRDVSTVGQGFGGVPVSDGTDYVTLENARKLQPNEYQLNSQLGYISLNQRLNNDEVLAVAFQYTVNGRVFQVGEFSTDGVDPTGGEIPPIDPGDEPVEGIPQSIVVKLLKSNITTVTEPIWDLMMKNIYSIGAFQLEQEDFNLNVLYTNPSPLNYISAAEGNMNFPPQPLPEDVANTILLNVFNLDRLNYNGDPQNGGDGFFDYIPGITVDTQNGRIIFTSVEPFGEYLFEKLRSDDPPAVQPFYDMPATYNANQNKYVYRSLYRTTKTQAEQEDSDKNKFQLKGTYKSTGADGIPIGAFNIPQGSVTVTAGGRTLVEGVDYTVNYQLGRVQILDPALLNSSTPINISTENNTLFGQQTKRFTGLNVEHKFNDELQIGATYINLNERPLTQKSSYNVEPINNTIIGFNANYSTEVPFLTRLVNKLPNIDTDVESNVSVRGEFAYLIPGAPKVSDFGGKATVYIDDFEASQTAVDVKSPLSWYLGSTPEEFRIDPNASAGDLLQYNYQRARLNWYTIDPIFYSSQRPEGINDEDLSSPFTRRVFRDEIFPEQDIIQGQTQALFPLDLAFYPSERGPYNYDPDPAVVGTNTLNDPQERFGAITRQLSTTDFERSNVEYIQFWVMDPYAHDDSIVDDGFVYFNLGNISEDLLRDGRKQYENGLPGDGEMNTNTTPTAWGKVPTNQSLVYTFDSTGPDRTAQDIGYDGLNDADEQGMFGGYANLPDPSNDNYEYFLQAEGNVLDRYRNYNGTEGNSPENVGDTNRGSTAQPDVEDINRDNTMNTVDAYYEYKIPIYRGMNVDNNTGMNGSSQDYITDVKNIDVTLPDNSVIPVRWVQFKIPIQEPERAVNGISDFRSIRFMRTYMTGFEQPTVLRFGTLELVRGDYRRYNQSLDLANPGQDPSQDDTVFDVEAVSIEENGGIYVLPPGVIREELNNNNNLIRQNEQSLALRVCGLEEQDARSVYKNFNVDMRQYENLEMFIHAQGIANETTPNDGDLVAFMRMGNDLDQNYYEVQIPLKISSESLSPEVVWPVENRFNLPLKLLQEIKTRTTNNTDEAVFFDQDELIEGSGSGPENDLRIGIKGRPSFGDVRIIMLGVRNATSGDLCGEVWFNELRLSELKNQGGWAAVANVDANLADFATVSATAGRSTVGFGSVDQGPNQRSREDVQQYDVVTNWNLGQLLPNKWGIQLPFNYGIGEEQITPQYDPELQDIELDTSLKNAATEASRDSIREQSIEYTRRQSVNFIGVRKERTSDSKPRIYDVENLTLSYSYNQVDHKSFEIEESLDQNVRAGATYNYNFTQKPYEPFKKNDSVFNGKYWQFLKDLNFNYVPTNLAVSSNIVRQYNEQKFREINFIEGNIPAPKLYQRNFLFDWQYTLNYNLTNSLRFNFNSANNRIINNYIDDEGNVNNAVGIWDGFFELGDPNRHVQSLQINYDLPTAKFPFLKFIRATYSYTGDFQWQDSSDLFNNIEIPADDGSDPIAYDLGNSVQNASSHKINSTLDMNNFYRYVGLKKITNGSKRASGVKGGGLEGAGDNGGGKTGGEQKGDETAKKKGSLSSDGSGGRGGRGGAGGAGGTSSLTGGEKAANTLIGLATSIKKIQFNYQETQGIYLPGYTPSVGFAGTVEPTFGFTMGSQSEIRDLAARKGWLTIYPEFNEQYTENESRQLDAQVNIELIPDLKIDLNGSRVYSENYAENYIVEDGVYRSLTPNTFGNFNISTLLIKTAFGKSDEVSSEAFDDFRSNRLVIAKRLAESRGIDTSDPSNLDDDGFPIGYGKTSQDVLLPAFVSAYKGSNASKEKTGILRDIPLPNWDVKYTGLMNLAWFKKRFKRFSIQHGYQAGYTVNQFQTNLDFDRNDPDAKDQAGNFKSKLFLTNVNLTEQFSPLVRVDFEMKNSVKILAEYRKDRALSLSFANNLLTEIQGNEVVLGLGYRIKDLRIGTNFGGKKKILRSDLNFKVDLSRRDNKTVIRYLDIQNNQTTAGQTIYGLQFSADYALSKNLTALFYYDHTFSEYAISTAFPQTTIRSGFTLRYNFGN